MVEANTHL